MTITAGSGDRRAGARETGHDVALHTTRHAWAALGAAAGALLLVGVLTLPLLDLLGLHEGDVFLMSRDVAGWAVELITTLLVLLPALAGAVLARRAAHRHGGAGAWTVLALSALLVGLAAYGFVDDVRMTYR